jgi:hypothetical protein
MRRATGANRTRGTRASAPIAVDHLIVSLSAQVRSQTNGTLRRNADHSGRLSCFLSGISTRLPRSIASALAMRPRVARGMITSSM